MTLPNVNGKISWENGLQIQIVVHSMLDAKMDTLGITEARAEANGTPIIAQQFARRHRNLIRLVEDRNQILVSGHMMVNATSPDVARVERMPLIVVAPQRHQHPLHCLMTRQNVKRTFLALGSMTTNVVQEKAIDDARMGMC